MLHFYKKKNQNQRSTLELACNITRIVIKYSWVVACITETLRTCKVVMGPMLKVLMIPGQSQGKGN